MSKPLILLTRQIPEAGLEMLEESCEVQMWHGEVAVPSEWLMGHIQFAKGLLCLLTDQIDKPVLNAANSLQVVSTMAVGYDHVNITECTRRGIPVGHTPGVLTETTADFAFALMMAAARRVVEGVRFVKDGSWKDLESDVITWTRFVWCHFGHRGFWPDRSSYGSPGERFWYASDRVLCLRWRRKRRC